MQQLSTPAEIGQYSVGVGFASLLLQIPAAVGIVIFSRSANSKEPAKFSKNITKLVRITFLLAILCGIALFILAPFVMTFLYGVAYLPSVTVVQFLLPGIIVLIVFKVLNMDLAGKGKPKISIIAFTPALIVNVILNYYWIPIYGANGAAFASTISYIFATLLFMYIYSVEGKY